ncbi:MAG: HigA family addiction module antitoxin [Mycobacteriales bacterium]
MDMHNPAHPGAVLREDYLAYKNMTVTEAAATLGVSRHNVSRVLHGHAGISANLAVRLELAGFGPARLWLGAQMHYDLWSEQQKPHADVRPHAYA